MLQRLIENAPYSYSLTPVLDAVLLCISLKRWSALLLDDGGLLGDHGLVDHLEVGRSIIVAAFLEVERSRDGEVVGDVVHELACA
jgi:hypothetical protein